jgi:hypothetical protein
MKSRHGFIFSNDDRIMEHGQPDARPLASWEARMLQVARCELPYEQALSLVLECVEVGERYTPSQPLSMSPAEPEAELRVMTNLASKLECNVRLAVYSLYHGDQIVEHDKAVQQLVECGKRSDAPA